MSKKLTIEYVREKYEERGYVLKSIEYINSRTKLDYICPNGHAHSITFNNFMHGHGCPYCSGNVKHTIGAIRDDMGNYGYRLESTVYANTDTRLDYVCPNGHRHSMSYNHFRQGERCPTCYNLSTYDDGNRFWKGGVKKLNIPLYDTYVKQLSVFEDVRIHMIRIGCVVYKSLQVRCNEHGCRKWFVPKQIAVRNRLQSFKGQVYGQNNFYCSEGCKSICSTYGQILYPKGYKQEKPYTQPEYDFYRKVVLERENHVCEYCGLKATNVHHEQTVKEQPMLSLDPDYGHAVCKDCHYKYGHKTGTECSTGNLAKKIC